MSILVHSSALCNPLIPLGKASANFVLLNLLDTCRSLHSYCYQQSVFYQFPTELLTLSFLAGLTKLSKLDPSASPSPKFSFSFCFPYSTQTNSCAASLLGCPEALLAFSQLDNCHYSAFLCSPSLTAEVFFFETPAWVWTLLCASSPYADAFPHTELLRLCCSHISLAV